MFHGGGGGGGEGGITKTREALRNLPYPGYHLTKFTRELFWGSTLTALYSLQLTFLINILP